MKKKKYILIVPIVVLIVSIIVICYILLTKVDKVNDIVNLNAVNKIVLMDGANGDLVEVTDEQQKKNIINSLDKLELKKYNGEDEDGWIFAIMLGTDNAEIKLTFISVEKCIDSKGNEYIIKNVDDNMKNLCNCFLN